jgi:hypothetical protein
MRLLNKTINIADAFRLSRGFPQGGKSSYQHQLCNYEGRNFFTGFVVKRFCAEYGLLIVTRKYLGRDCSVGLATRYGLDCRGIVSRWGARFSAPLQTGPGAHPASYTMGTESLLGLKRPGQPPSSAEVKERVQLYLFFPSEVSWPVLG